MYDMYLQKEISCKWKCFAELWNNDLSRLLKSVIDLLCNLVQVVTNITRKNFHFITYTNKVQTQKGIAKWRANEAIAFA